jgi:hypothetical protein
MTQPIKLSPTRCFQQLCFVCSYHQACMPGEHKCGSSDPLVRAKFDFPPLATTRWELSCCICHRPVPLEQIIHR